MYEIIDERLKIKSCSVADLTAELVNGFLSGREEGKKIEDLTFYYESKTGYFVFNRNNKYAAQYLELTKLYLEADQSGADMDSLEIPESLVRFVEVLREGLKKRKEITSASTEKL